jgi:hypothetical protein
MMNLSLRLARRVPTLSVSSFLDGFNSHCVSCVVHDVAIMSKAHMHNPPNGATDQMVTLTQLLNSFPFATALPSIPFRR